MQKAGLRKQLDHLRNSADAVKKITALAELPEDAASLRARVVAELGDPSKTGILAVRTRSEAARQVERSQRVRTGP